MQAAPLSGVDRKAISDQAILERARNPLKERSRTTHLTSSDFISTDLVVHAGVADCLGRRGQNDSAICDFKNDFISTGNIRIGYMIFQRK